MRASRRSMHALAVLRPSSEGNGQSKAEANQETVND